MMTPEISIIIPVYNGEKYLEQCLNSICEQTYSDFEVIIINDGSTDGSQKILNSFQKKIHAFTHIKFQIVEFRKLGI